MVGVRPEHIHIGVPGGRQATIYSTLPSGMETTVRLNVDGTQLTSVVFGDVDYPVDSQVSFALSRTAILFDPEDGGRNAAQGTVRLL